MPRVRELKTNFVAGELDPLLLGRTDIKHYFNAGERLRNVIIIPQGGVSIRPGSRVVIAIPDVPEVDGGGVSNVRLIEFQFSASQTYLILIHHKAAWIFRDGAKVAEVALPYSSGDLLPTFNASGDMQTAGLSWAHSKDALILFHEAFPIKKLMREGSHSDWSFGDFEIRNVPRYDFGADDYGAPVTATAATHPVGAGSAPANLIDGDPGTVSAISSIGNLSAADLAARIVARIDLGDVVDLAGAKISAISADAAIDGATLVYSSDDVTWREFGEPINIKATAATVTRSVAIDARYIGLAMPASDLTGRTVTIGGVDALPYTAGVDEVQQIEFPMPGDQGNWTEGDTFTLIVEDEETNHIRWAADGGTLARRIQEALRLLPNTSRDGITCEHDDGKFIVTFGGDDGARAWGSMAFLIVSSEQIPSLDIFVQTNGRRAGEYAWSAARGYPRCGAFFQGRLYVAGTPSLPHWLWASRAGFPNDMNSEKFAADYGIAAAIDADDVPAILAIYVSRHMQVFTTLAEFYVPGSDEREITPENFVARRTTARGMRAGLRVFEVDGATHFVQAGGRALREFIYVDAEAAYQANNISLLSPHLMRSPVDCDLRRSTSTTDADYEFLVNADGTMSVFCTLRTQEVNGFVLWSTQGAFKSVGVAGDDVYWTVTRTVDGKTVQFLEVMDTSIHVDCATVVDGAASIGFVTHLPNSTIEVLLDGIIQPATSTNAAGACLFERPAASGYVAGLKFPEVDPVNYPGRIALVQTLPVELNLPEGSTLGRKRRIVSISARLHETVAVSIRGEALEFRNFGSGLLDAPISPFTGVHHMRGLLGWDFAGSVEISTDKSLPFTLLALSMGVSI